MAIRVVLSNFCNQMKVEASLYLSPVNLSTKINCLKKSKPLHKISLKEAEF